VRNVLFLDYFFPPLLGDWRGAAFSKLLPEYGWRPIVVSAAETVTYDKDYDMMKEIPEGLIVRRVPHRKRSLARYLMDGLKIAADFPDPYWNWCSPAYREARRILREEDIHLIYSASPAYTTAFVAMKVKRDYNIPWVADFLDGWAVNDFLNQYYDQNLIKPLRWLQKRRVRNAERTILESADRVVVIHRHVKERWRELHGINDTKIRVITDGYEESVFHGLRPRALYENKLTVTFLGSFYPAFRELILKFARVVNTIDPSVELAFIGRVAAAVHEMNLSNSTCIMHAPRRKAIEFGMGSDFLLVVMPPYARWTPSKIYDYLRMERPILALVPSDGDAAKIIREAKAGFVLDFDDREMKNQLEVIFRKWKEGEFRRFRPDHKYVTNFERRRLTRQMARIFDEVSP
jgi:glycosyltransferase involved in cell wall biosynthesis